MSTKCQLNWINQRTESIVFSGTFKKFLFCEYFTSKGPILKLNNKCDIYTNILGRQTFENDCIYAVRLIFKVRQR